MIEIAIFWCYGHPWVVSAVCDLVTLSACMGIVVLMLHRSKTHTPAPVIAPPAPEPVKAAPAPVAPAELTIAAPATNRVQRLVKDGGDSLPTGKRQAVNRALDAMTRWEATYRPGGRGLAELARLAERPTGQAVRRAAWEE